MGDSFAETFWASPDHHYHLQELQQGLGAPLLRVETEVLCTCSHLILSAASARVVARLSTVAMRS